MEMPVDECRTGGVIEIVRVDVIERRLIEPQQQGRCAQDCARNPHEYKPLYQIRRSLARDGPLDLFRFSSLFADRGRSAGCRSGTQKRAR